MKPIDLSLILRNLIVNILYVLICCFPLLRAYACFFLYFFRYLSLLVELSFVTQIPLILALHLLDALLEKFIGIIFVLSPYKVGFLSVFILDFFSLFIEFPYFTFEFFILVSLPLVILFRQTGDIHFCGLFSDFQRQLLVLFEGFLLLLKFKFELVYFIFSRLSLFGTYTLFALTESRFNRFDLFVYLGISTLYLRA